MKGLMKMIHAYDKTYLEKARVALGRMLDFAVYDLEIPLSSFWNTFLLSDISTKMERGDSSILCGKSGIELAYDVIDDEKRTIKPRYTENRSPEYWLGWVLAFYQWKTNKKFVSITRNVSIEDILKLYSPYHEMDIKQFCDKLNELNEGLDKETNIKRLRKAASLSQNELSSLSGVPLRTLQQYEQGRKNINKAQVEYLICISKVLCCDIQDLLE